MSSRHSPGSAPLEDLIRRARLDGARAAEAFHKAGCGRRTVLEPAAHPGSRPRVSVSTFEEEGIALRLVDPKGRSGFAWRSPFGASGVRELVDAAFASAGHAVDHAPAPPFAPAGEPRVTDDLQIDDREVLTAPAEKISCLLEEASEAAGGSAGQAAVVDRASLSEARATVTLANSLGFEGSYSKTLALLSVSMVPDAPGASSVLEERSSCRLRDLDPRECALTAALRSLPPRSPDPPPGGDPTVILAQRAAASFIATLVSWRFPGGEESIRAGPGGRPASERMSHARRGQTARGTTDESPGLQVVDDPLLPGAAGSAPFDGAGRVWSRTVLLTAGPGIDLPPGERSAYVRHSFREPPAAGLTNVYVSTGEGAGPPATRRHTRVPVPSWTIEGPILRIEVARFTAGPIWTMHVLRGEWMAGSPRGHSSLGPADGIVWKGPLSTLLDSVAGVGEDLAFFHLGVPIGAPTLALRGLVPWIVARERRVKRETISPAPSSSDAPRKERRRTDRRADE